MRLDVNTNHPKYGELLALAAEISGLERIVKDNRGRLAEAQTKLAQIVCPYVRGNSVRYKRRDEEHVAVVTEIVFSPAAPHYTLIVRKRISQGAGGLGGPRDCASLFSSMDTTILNSPPWPKSSTASSTVTWPDPGSPPWPFCSGS